MSAWKKINQQDIFLTSYIAKKTWSLDGTAQRENGVYFLPFDSNTEDSYIEGGPM